MSNVHANGKKYETKPWKIGDCAKCAFGTMDGNGCEIEKHTIAFDCLSFDGFVGVYFVEVNEEGKRDE